MNYEAIIRAQASQIETLTAENRMLRAEYERLFEHRKAQLEREHRRIGGTAYRGKTKPFGVRVASIHAKTGERREFDTIKQAARFHRVPYGTMYVWLGNSVPKRQHLFERA